MRRPARWSRPPGEDRRVRLFGLQERGTLFVGPGEDVYEGMIVGENDALRSRRKRDRGEAGDHRPGGGGRTS